MKLFLTILTILSFQTANSQVTPASFVSKAFNFNYKENKVDSAIKCYQDLRRTFPNYREAFILYQIANCFLKIGDTTQAEFYYLNSMQIDNKKDSLEYGFGRTYSCAKLAKLYYDQKKYRKALIYMDYTKNEYKPLRTICQGGYGPTTSLLFHYKKAVCYYGLNKKDSSIITLAPYIFRVTDYYYIDSSEYDLITKFFTSTLFELYGKYESKTQMIHALAEIDYLQKIKAEPESIFKSVDVNCTINLWGIKINLDDGCTRVQTKGEPIPEYLSQHFLLAQFTNSPCYKVIME